MDQERNLESAPQEKRPHRAWSVYLLKVSGIPIYLHVTFLVMIAFFAMADFYRGDRLLGSVMFIITIFASIALHELGHALMARRFGIKTDDIVLYPIGGIARLKSMGEGFQEFWISIAGPAVNVVIASLIFVFLLLTKKLVPINQVFTEDGHFLQAVMQVNIILVIFNLVPAFPMDGGRVLRAILAQTMPREKATNIAAKIGQGLAIIFILLGLLGKGPMLMFIGFFVFMAASQEAAATRSAVLLTGRKVREAMITHYDTLGHADSLGRAAQLLLATSQQDFPVQGGSDIIGVLSRKDLIQGLISHGPDHYVAEVMAREFPRYSPDDDLGKAIEQLREASGLPVMVFDGDQFVGFINNENVMEFLLINSAGGGGQSRGISALQT